MPTIESEAVAQPKYQIFIYFFTSASASPCAPKHSNVPLIVTMPSTASTTEKRNTSTSPEVASRAARPCRPPPSACAVVVITPTPSPRKTQPISMMTGKVNPIAASGISE